LFSGKLLVATWESCQCVERAGRGEEEEEEEEEGTRNKKKKKQKEEEGEEQERDGFCSTGTGVADSMGFQHEPGAARSRIYLARV